MFVLHLIPKNCAKIVKNKILESKVVKMNMISRASALVYTVRIPGFHPGGPGSIPGCGIFLFLINYPQNSLIQPK